MKLHISAVQIISLRL